MSLATLGAVSAATNELPLPDTSSLSLGEVLILSGGGGTTEAVVIRSIASGRNIGATVSRGALGTLRLAHATPTTVTIYDPSGGGGGGGVTVEVPPAAPVAVSNIVAPGATFDGDEATLLYFTLRQADVSIATPGFLEPPDAGVSVIDIPAGALFQAFIVQTVTFDQRTEVDLSCGESPGGTTETLASYGDVGSQTVPSFGAVEPSFNAQGVPGTAHALTANIGKWMLATADVHIYAAAFPSDDPLTGAIRVYAIIATPAS